MVWRGDRGWIEPVGRNHGGTHPGGARTQLRKELRARRAVPRAVLSFELLLHHSPSHSPKTPATTRNGGQPSGPAGKTASPPRPAGAAAQPDADRCCFCKERQTAEQTVGKVRLTQPQILTGCFADSPLD